MPYYAYPPLIFILSLHAIASNTLLRAIAPIIFPIIFVTTGRGDRTNSDGLQRGCLRRAIRRRTPNNHIIVKAIAF
ncbi:hypothetical protein [uncultured Nostoc sp.]|uniref:hypothetical protein n=1 Tax=uncultured Nostoc sp. TaxID=340711 RepID=UPI0035CB34E3